MEEIQEAFLSLLVAVITGSICLISLYIQKYMSKLINRLEAETNVLEDEILRDNANFALNTIESIIHDTVYSLQVSLVEDIKKASVDGKLTKEEAESIFNMAKEKITDQVPDSLLLMATNSIGNIEEFINLKIEEQLDIVKKEIGRE